MTLKINVPGTVFENFVDVLPTISFDFTTKKLINSGMSNKVTEFNFSRASSAYRTNENGLLELVQSNMPRFEYDPVTLKVKGLLVEGASQNDILFSEDFTQASWAKESLVIGIETISPDGTLSAKKLISNATANSPAKLTQNTTSGEINRYVTASGYFKKGDFSTVFLQLTGPQNCNINYNFDSGQVVLGSGVFHHTIEDAPNGFKRISLTGITSAANVSCDVFISNDAGNLMYASDGTKGTYAWGLQLENYKSFSTSYIKTLSSRAVRAAEIIHALSNEDIGVQSVGIHAEYYTKHTSSGLLEFLVQIGTINNRVAAGFKNGALLSSRKNSGAATILISSTQDGVNKLNKIFAQQSAGKSSLAVNGTLNSRTVSDFPSNLRDIRIGSQGGPSTYPNVGDFFGVIKRISIIEVALTDNMIRSRTS